MHVLQFDISYVSFNILAHPAATQKGVVDFQLQCTCMLRFSHYVCSYIQGWSQQSLSATAIIIQFIKLLN